ncbi:hypothetical protein [Streptomyces sp. L7]
MPVGLVSRKSEELRIPRSTDAAASWADVDVAVIESTVLEV